MVASATRLGSGGGHLRHLPDQCNDCRILTMRPTFIVLALTVTSLLLLGDGPGGAPLWVALACQAVGFFAAGVTAERNPWIVAGLVFLPALIADVSGLEAGRGEGPPLALIELLYLPGFLVMFLVGQLVRR